MPASLERCVEKLLKRKTFKPKAKEEERKDSAYAICTAATQNKKNSEIAVMLSELPEYINIDIDENGWIRLSEVEGYKFDDENEDSLEDPIYDLHFNENTEERDDISLAMPYEVKLEDKDEDGFVNIEMLRAGNFAHWAYGDIKFDKKYFMSCIENFANEVVDREISIDSQHRPSEGAVAWVKKVGLKSRAFKDKKRRFVLTGDVELTDWGRKLIEGKRFKYFSIEVRDNFRDKEDQEKEYGPTIMGGGITNRPFIPGMKSIEMSEDADINTSTEPVVGTDDDPQSFNTDPQDPPAGQDDPPKDADQTTSLTEQELLELEELEYEFAAAGAKARPPDSKLPNAAFALIKRDAKGNVTKRSLPHHGPSVKSPDQNSTVDVPRLRNALARVNQVKGFSAQEIAKGRAHLERHARALLKTSKDKKKASEPEGEELMNLEEMIADLQKQFSELEDKNSETAKKLSDQLTLLTELFEKQNASDNDGGGNDDPPKPDNDAIVKEFEDKLAEERKLREQSAKKLADMESELAVAREERRVAKIKVFCDKMGEDKHFPAVIKEVRAILLAEPQDKAFAITLSEDDKNVDYSFADAVKKILDAIPAEGRVKETVQLSGDTSTTPDTNGADDNKIKLADGEVDFMSDEAIAASIKRAGHKTSIQ